VARVRMQRRGGGNGNGNGSGDGGPPPPPPPPPPPRSGKLYRLQPQPESGTNLFLVDGLFSRNIPDESALNRIYLGRFDVRTPLSDQPIETLRTWAVADLEPGPPLTRDQAGTFVRPPGGDEYRVVALDLEATNLAVFQIPPSETPYSETLDVLFRLQERRNRLIISWDDDLPMPSSGFYPTFFDGAFFDDYSDEGQDLWVYAKPFLRRIPDDYTAQAIWGVVPLSVPIVDPLLPLYISGAEIPSRLNGRAYAAQSDPADVFIMRDGRRRRIANERSQIALGVGRGWHSFRPIQVIAGQDMEAIPRGTDLNFDIEHVVVLMFENRSFDHIFGWLTRWKPEVNGIDPANPTRFSNFYYDESTWQPDRTRPVPVTDRATYVTTPDPDHELDAVAFQLSGRRPDASKPFPLNLPTDLKRDGAFVGSYQLKLKRQPENVAAATIMDCFDLGSPDRPDSQLPIFTTLARSFTVCDRWHASVPGPTIPNRLFAHAGTAAGYAKSPFQDTLDLQGILAALLQTLQAAGASVGDLFSQGGIKALLEAIKNDPFGTLSRTLDQISPAGELGQLTNSIGSSIYDVLEANGKSWGIYVHDFTEAVLIRSLRDRFIDNLRISFDDEGLPSGENQFMLEAQGLERSNRSGFHTFGTLKKEAQRFQPPGPIAFPPRVPPPPPPPYELPAYAFVTPRYQDSPVQDAIWRALAQAIADIQNEETSEWGDLGSEDAWSAIQRGTVAQLVAAVTSRLLASDGHPSNDMRGAELLLARTYDVLRESTDWERTVLIVIFDEHGGFYDHVTPPRAGTLTGEFYGPTTPGFRASIDPTFDFDRLGLRVPALIVSPWIEENAPTFHALYDHTALLDSVLRLCGIDIGTGRFSRLLYPEPIADLFTAESARTDCPTGLETLFESLNPDYREEAP
jgi:phospholipase C